jgi:phosphomannomutase
MDIFRNILETKPPESIAGMRVQKNIVVDGHKFILDDNTWIGFRVSGMESLIRIYAKFDLQTKLKKLLKTGRDFVYRK